MTVRELMDLLATYPPDAVVYVDNADTDEVVPVQAVTPSQDAPETEVYIEGSAL